jgi:trimethylamine--corrinoid protein Co-methyltransferase
MPYADRHRVPRRVRLSLLAPDDARRIHEATLEVLETVGVVVHSPRALEVLADHGAAVDRDTTVARIPAAAVERALASVPHTVVLGARDPAFDLPLDGEHLFLSADGCGVATRDPWTGEVRPSRKQDVADCARVVEALDGLAASSAVVSALDCPPGTRVLHEFDACVRNSRKHTIVVSIKEEREARHLLRMAEALAGGREELRRRPLFTAIVCTVSPLQQERFGMDLALFLAAAGIPVSFYPMPILGATAPASVAGAAVVNNAEFLSALTVVQLACPGAPVLHGGGPTAMSMRSGAYLSNAPEALVLRGLQGHMADFYGVPAWYGAGATTAKEPGLQSAWENALGMFMAYANGADLTFGSGLLDGSRILCLESLVVDAEVFGVVKRLLAGVAVNEETLAVDLIRETGFAGAYLAADHTRRHARDLWQPLLAEVGTYEAWRAAGSPSTLDRARALLRAALAAEVEPLPDDLAGELAAIIAAAEAEAN